MGINAASYDHAPIGSLVALAHKLGIEDEAALVSLAENAESYYRPGSNIPKPDGTVRATLRTVGPLRKVQNRIKKTILDHVNWPPYLMGGISSDTVQRGPSANAAVHSRPSVLISADIEHFFPSVTPQNIEHIWVAFFGFAPIVAKRLTELTARSDGLPQGVSTSTALANLMFFDLEPMLYAKLRGAGLYYTRYVDDIFVSSPTNIPGAMRTWVMREIVAMLARRGFKVKRRKQKIAPRHHPQTVTGLQVNSGRVTVPQRKRNAIRAEVHRLIKADDISRESQEYWKAYKSALGKVYALRPFHPKLSAELERTLKSVPPKVSNEMVTLLRRDIRHLKDEDFEVRQTTAFRKRIRQLRARAGSIRRARPREAKNLLRILRSL